MCEPFPPDGNISDDISKPSKCVCGKFRIENWAWSSSSQMLDKLELQSFSSDSETNPVPVAISARLLIAKVGWKGELDVHYRLRWLFSVEDSI
jgi:hypothetical protein